MNKTILVKAILFLSILFIVSCSSNNSIPKNVIQPPAMSALMWDLMRADEFVSNFQRKDSSHTFKDKSTFLYEEVFKIHHTDKAQFEKSISFYKLHPDMFKTVVDSLEKKKSSAMTESYRPSKLPDSLRAKVKHLPAK
ncbi:MAG: DUF4296 domain-containing protein [Chitinophagaceae bacterium]